MTMNQSPSESGTKIPQNCENAADSVSGKDIATQAILLFAK
jgi:hypothetical protein